MAKLALQISQHGKNMVLPIENMKEIRIWLYCFDLWFLNNLLVKKALLNNLLAITMLLYVPLGYLDTHPTYMCGNAHPAVYSVCIYFTLSISHLSTLATFHINDLWPLPYTSMKIEHTQNQPSDWIGDLGSKVGHGTSLMGLIKIRDIPC